MIHAYKKVAKRVLAQYRPAAAVRARGDNWTYGHEVWNISSATLRDLRGNTQDFSEFIAMLDMELGTRSRV